MFNPESSQMLAMKTSCNLRRLQRLQSKCGAIPSSSATHVQPCVGVRREESSVWERRAPLAPHHVRTLVDAGHRVLVQPSTRRAYSMFEYRGAGAEISEDLSIADIILGVKAMPVECLSMLENKTVAFFSHTIKAQEANMPLLDACLEKVGGIRIMLFVLRIFCEINLLFNSMINVLRFVGFVFIVVCWTTRKVRGNNNNKLHMGILVYV